MTPLDSCAYAFEETQLRQLFGPVSHVMSHFCFSELPDKCSRPLDPGSNTCDNVQAGVRWYFNSDPDVMSCESFMYNGCDSNENKFSSLQECMESCECHMHH